MVGRDFVDESGMLGQWFDAFECDAVLLRPDRYVFGVANGSLETQSLMDGRAAALASVSRQVGSAVE